MLDGRSRDLAPLVPNPARQMHNGRTAARFSCRWAYRPPHWGLQRDVLTVSSPEQNLFSLHSHFLHS
jgi:hypothetical protein